LRIAITAKNAKILKNAYRELIMAILAIPAIMAILPMIYTCWFRNNSPSISGIQQQ